MLDLFISQQSTVGMTRGEIYFGFLTLRFLVASDYSTADTI